MKIYIQDHASHAGKWIYSGYAHAWAYLDHQVVFINNLSEVKTNEQYKLFICDSKVTQSNLQIVKNSYKTYLYVQPNSFPDPWGRHPNFQCSLEDSLINELNNLNNVIKWNFAFSFPYHSKWKNVVSVPLAFDDINYNYEIPDSFDYDICFIGGMADNGFNEKAFIMQETLNYFITNSGLKCAFAVGRNLSHEQENHILLRSKIALNIHDAYQRHLGLDTNERTFKSLGCTGILISDNIQQAKDLFYFSFFSNDLQKSVEEAKRICSLKDSDLTEIKKYNQRIILRKHTYVNRVQQLLSLK
jgi:spore maturation protein CgeB